jgi:hypothetical protein
MVKVTTWGSGLDPAGINGHINGNKWTMITAEAAWKQLPPDHEVEERNS